MKSVTRGNYQQESADVISVEPHEGTLKSHEKKAVYFKFSPRFTKPTKGWKKEDKLEMRQDFAMFMSVCSVDGCAGVTMENKSTFWTFWTIQMDNKNYLNLKEKWCVFILCSVILFFYVNHFWPIFQFHTP